MPSILLPLLLLAADTGTVPRAPQYAVPVTYNATVTVERDDWLGEDKFKHFAMSYMITTAAFGTARMATDRDASLTVGIAIGTAAGILKEIYDKRDNRRLSVKDMMWDAAGIAAGAIVAKQTR